MTDFTPKQLQTLNDVWFKLWPTSIGNFDQLKAELTKPGFQPNDEQVVFSEGTYSVYAKGYLDNHIMRPLTTKEAGPGCMQHLVDALREISVNLELSEAGMSVTADDALAKHKELMKGVER